jgi:predicted transcriptional regulator
MKKLVPGLKSVLMFSLMLILAGIYTYKVGADSTITLPVPENIDDKQVTISLRIPPNTEPLNRKQTRPKLKSKRSLIMWESNPSPKIANNDEIHSIFNTFLRKGWVKSHSTRSVMRMRPMDKYFAVRTVQHIANSVLEIAQAPNFGRVIKKCNLTTSDIEDLRRMIKRFEKDLIIFGSNPRNLDKDLLMLQERFKKARQGILKVLRVEGADDGSTVIHLSVD